MFVPAISLSLFLSSPRIVTFIVASLSSYPNAYLILFLFFINYYTLHAALVGFYISFMGVMRISVGKEGIAVDMSVPACSLLKG